MASISKAAGRDGYRLSFYGLNKRKRSIWLGGFTKRAAESWKAHVEALLVAQASGTPVETHTAAWLGGLSPEMRKKLIHVGLLRPDGSGECPQTLQAFLDYYTTFRRDVKPGTHLVYRRTVTCLVQFFGPDRKLSSITAADAEAWRVWLATQGNQRDKGRDDMADNTVRRRTGIVRQFFAHACKRKLISENPFAGLSAQVHGNPKRQRFVTRAEIQTALDACVCPDLRAVIALSRFAGLRVPSEVIRLTWADVDLEAGRLTIHAAKTEHHADGGIRFCPIFPELRPLWRLFATAQTLASTAR